LNSASASGLSAAKKGAQVASRLLRISDLSDYLVKAGIRSKRVHEGMPFHFSEKEIVVLSRLVQPLERVILLSECRENTGDVEPILNGIGGRSCEDFHGVASVLRPAGSRTT
jgi:hypothetical protein